MLEFWLVQQCIISIIVIYFSFRFETKSNGTTCLLPSAR